ncbi:inovirus Gp2 family protein [Motilimonas eburnea]|uniref:inovirus Gp2 family protein n=1 Tax=Motilimonas eburnea TaxID=1737488 RepID=UPI001E6462F5|nr:inovirus Gp2 family protein [Motilimonas eburnea]MCE2573912.1 inovirus Gp2 family protein [Motilimonas eburnea]
MSKNHYKGLPIQGSVKDYNVRYLDRTLDTMDYTFDDYRRVYAVRIDLKLPQAPHELDCLSRDEIISYCQLRDRLISRFVESIKAKIKAADRRDQKINRRVYPTNVRFIWCRERDTSENDHFHVALLLNKDRFCRLGDWKSRGSLAGVIIESWASAIDLEFDDTLGLVHFSKNGEYRLNQNDRNFNQQYSELFYRLSYLAKKRTKHYGEGRRNFGCSQR